MTIVIADGEIRDFILTKLHERYGIVYRRAEVDIEYFLGIGGTDDASFRIKAAVTPKKPS